jgi:hypothetical protein
MLILDENKKSILINSLYDPIVSNFMWVLDLNIMDFTLAPITMIEETVCPTKTIEINGFQFKLPASWYMLVYDEVTTQLDSVSIADLTTNSFTALIYGPDATAAHSAKVKVIDYSAAEKNVYPSFNRHLMLCHPVSDNKWINISFSDSYNRFLRDKYISDLIY